MATKNLSAYDASKVPSAAGMRFGIVVSEWNWEVTGALADGAFETLLKHGANEEDIDIRMVPGSFELPLGGQFFAEAGQVDAVILLGCVIQGETRHFDFICQGVTQGAMDLNLKYNLPFIFGVLTTENQQQALDPPIPDSVRDRYHYLKCSGGPHAKFCHHNPALQQTCVLVYKQHPYRGNHKPQPSDLISLCDAITCGRARTS